MLSFPLRKKLAVVAVSAAVAGSGSLAIAQSSASAPAGTAVPSQAAGSIQPVRTGPTAYDFGETLATLGGKALETTFMGEIVMHHRAAIQMALLERKRGRDRDIRTHAMNIISSQRDQITQFRTWLDRWYGLTPAQARGQASPEARAEMTAMMKESDRRMNELQAVPSGPRFDVAFVRMMIPHHTSGVVEFLEPQARAPHPQLRVAATTGLMSQEAEIADFRTWLSRR